MSTPVEQGSMVHPMLAYIGPAYLSLSKTLDLYQGCLRIAEAALLKNKVA